MFDTKTSPCRVSEDGISKLPAMQKEHLRLCLVMPVHRVVVLLGLGLRERHRKHQSVYSAGRNHRCNVSRRE